MISERAIRAVVDVRDAQLVGRAEVRGHRALRVVGDENVTTPRRALARRGDRQVDLDAHRREVVREALAEVVVGDLADVAAGPAERRDAGDGVRDRAAGHLDRRTHGVEEGLELVLLDQRHRRLHETEVAVHLVRILRDDVEHRVANAGHRQAIRTGFHAQ